MAVMGPTSRRGFFGALAALFATLLGRRAAAPAARWCASGNSAKWLAVDLGQERNVDEVVVYHATSDGEDPSFDTKRFDTEVSADGKAWTPVGRPGRYVRIVIRQNDQLTRPVRIYAMDVLSRRELSSRGAG